MVEKKKISKKPIKHCVAPSRIKKIMQMEEDIGKINQYAPIVVSKAVELFIKDIVACLMKDNQKLYQIEKVNVIEMAKKYERFDFIEYLDQEGDDNTNVEEENTDESQ